MDTETMKPATAIETLEFSYVLCAIESRIWTGVITDSASTVEFTQSKEAETDSGKFMKALVKSSALGKIKNAVNKARAALYVSSVPWLASSHLVKIDRMQPLTESLGAFVKEFDEAVEQFLSEYPKLVEGAEVRLGKLFNKSDYPTAAALRQRFSLDVVWLPVNQVNSSQMAILDNAIANAVERSARDATAKAMANAHQKMIDRAIETVEGSAEALKRYSQKKKDGNRAVLHESRVDDLTQTAKDLTAYTFPIDNKEAERIEQIACDIATVAAEGSDTLKENEAARKQAEAKLAEIKARLASMQAF